MAGDIRYRVPPIDLPLVHEKFHRGMFGDFGDVIRARIAELQASKKWEKRETVRFYEWLLGEVDAEQYGALQEIYLRPPVFHFTYLKYLDPLRWFEHKLAFAHRLGLHERKGLRVLDLGTGPCHFCVVARFYGHKAIGTERPPAAQVDPDDEAAHLEHVRQQMFDRFAAIFRVSRVRHAVEPLQDVSALPPSDLVTCFSVAFDRSQDWNADAWAFFLDSLHRHVLARGGAAFFTLIKKRLVAENWAYLATRSRPAPEGEAWIDFAPR